MREMGREAETEHARLGEQAGACGARAVFFHGEHAAAVGEGLTRSGFTGVFAAADTPEAFVRTLAGIDLPGGVLLFKGSRAMRMEDYVTAFTQSIQKDAEA